MLRSRFFTQWASALALLLSVATMASAQADFGFYPDGSEDCLYAAADQTDCETGDVREMNACFCSNEGNFITNTARCVGEEASNLVGQVFDTMQDACATSNTPMGISESEFLAAAAGEDDDTTTTTTTEEPTSTETTTTREPSSTEESTITSEETTTEAPAATNTSDESDDDDEDDGGLSQGATIGIGVGAGVGGLALIGAVAFFFVRRRRRQTDEGNPMLPEYRQSRPTTFPPSEPSPAFGGFTDAKTTPSVSPYTNNTHLSGAWQSPPLFQSPQSPPQPYPQQSYTAFSSPEQQQQQFSPYAQQSTFAGANHGPPHQGAFEIDGVQQHVAEMPGSAPTSHWR